MITVGAAGLGRALGALNLQVDDLGRPTDPVVVVDLDDGTPDGDVIAAVQRSRRVVVGRASRPVADANLPLASALACTVASHPRSSAEVGTSDVDAATEALVAAIERSPRAASVLQDVLAATTNLAIHEALVVESLAYSMLLAGAEFTAWLRSRARRPVPAFGRPAVTLERVGATLYVTLDRPERHNAFGVAVRDALVAGFDLALHDRSIDRVVMRGNGPSFCSGGDLDEFGTTPDLTTAHLVRLDRSVGARIAPCADRTTAVVHGACIGAGAELPAFAGRVEARRDAFFQLPEISMGLIPGAGGTVSIPRRIGRWRTAYLALSGARLDLDTALAWGLVDAVVE